MYRERERGDACHSSPQGRVSAEAQREDAALPGPRSLIYNICSIFNI